MQIRRRTAVLLVVLVALLGYLFVRPPRDVEVGFARGTHLSYALASAGGEGVAALKVPPGFVVERFAEVPDARMMAVTADGTALVTSPDAGAVFALRDDDGDGRSEAPRKVASLARVHGIAIAGDAIYLATPREIRSGKVGPRGEISGLRTISDGLPGGGHTARTLGVGPDGLLYVSVGSTCNVCVEKNPEQAAILRLPATGGKREVFARGLRNTEAFTWMPGSGAMWGMDNGVDWRGDDAPPEELNLLQQGKHYGWPYCFGDRRPDPSFENPPGTTKAKFCATTEPMALGAVAHGAPLAIVFYEGKMFPAEYRGDAFATLHGSWNREPKSGYEVARIHFENGRPVRFATFVGGPVGGRTYLRPTGLAVLPDGSLLVADDRDGRVLRVRYAAAKR